MAPVNPATVKAAVSVGKAIFGFLGGRRKKKEARKAQKEAMKRQQQLDEYKDQYAQLDLSNPYANMQNIYEDLTVNKQQFELARQQQQQSRANILDRLRTSAGASGVAALAQSLANQGSLDAQKASALIGEQEQANQQTALGEASRLRDLERSGDIAMRQAEFDILESQIGMTADAQANFGERARIADQQRQGSLGNMFKGFKGMGENWGAEGEGGMVDLFKGVKNFFGGN